MKWHCAVALLKALTTYTIHSATETYKNYANENITSFMHKRTNNLLKIIIVPWTSPSDAVFTNVKSAGSRHGKTGGPFWPVINYAIRSGHTQSTFWGFAGESVSVYWRLNCWLCRAPLWIPCTQCMMVLALCWYWPCCKDHSLTPFFCATFSTILRIFATQ